MESQNRLQSALLIAHNDSMREDTSDDNFSRSWKSSASQEREFRGRKRDAFVRLQSLVQAFMRPAEWCFGCRATHRIREKWVVDKNPEDFCDKLFHVLDATTDVEASKLKIGHISNQMPAREFHKYHCASLLGHQFSCELHAEFLLLSPNGWLDVLDVCISSCNSFVETGSEFACSAELTLVSTGVCPVQVLCAPVFNAALFFVPFVSYNQQSRMEFIAEKIQLLGCRLISRTEMNSL